MILNLTVVMILTKNSTSDESVCKNSYLQIWARMILTILNLTVWTILTLTHLNLSTRETREKVLTKLSLWSFLQLAMERYSKNK